MTNWQTNIFHSSSYSVLFFFVDNPHNTTLTVSQCSLLLSVAPVQRTGGYKDLDTPQNCVEYTAQRTELLFIVRHACIVHTEPQIIFAAEKSCFVKVYQWIESNTCSILKGESSCYPLNPSGAVSLQDPLEVCKRQRAWRVASMHTKPHNLYLHSNWKLLNSQSCLSLQFR